MVRLGCGLVPGQAGLVLCWSWELGGASFVTRLRSADYITPRILELALSVPSTLLRESGGYAPLLAPSRSTREEGYREARMIGQWGVYLVPTHLAPHVTPP